MAVLIEKYVVMPSRVDPTRYGVYDRLEEKYVVAYVNGESTEDSYRKAWLYKEKIDHEHEHKKEHTRLSELVWNRKIGQGGI